MTTQKNTGARRQETREEKQQRLADPTLDAMAADLATVQRHNPTLQSGMTAARRTEFENRKRELEADIVGLQRQKDRAARGYAKAAADAYVRIYDRIARLAQVLADEFGQAVEIPEYDPPVDGRTGKQVTIKPRSAAERARDGQYRETKGLGPSGQGGPRPGFPGSDEDTAWLNVQAARK